MTEVYEDASDFGQRKKRREPTPVEMQYRSARDVEHQYQTGQRLKTLQEKQYDREHPVRARGRHIVDASQEQVAQSYRRTNKTMSGSRVRKFLSGFGVRGSDQGSPHSGLSTIVEEISRGYVEPFSRSYFKEPNQADRDFFGNQNQPVERDFFGDGINTSNIDMNHLTNIENKNKKEDLI